MLAPQLQRQAPEAEGPVRAQLGNPREEQARRTREKAAPPTYRVVAVRPAERAAARAAQVKCLRSRALRASAPG
jgi:hypothetical protein